MTLGAETPGQTYHEKGTSTLLMSSTLESTIISKPESLDMNYAFSRECDHDGSIIGSHALDSQLTGQF